MSPITEILEWAAENDPYVHLTIKVHWADNGDGLFYVDVEAETLEIFPSVDLSDREIRRGKTDDDEPIDWDRSYSTSKTFQGGSYGRGARREFVQAFEEACRLALKAREADREPNP